MEKGGPTDRGDHPVGAVLEIEKNRERVSRGVANGAQTGQHVFRRAIHRYAEVQPVNTQRHHRRSAGRTPAFCSRQLSAASGRSSKVRVASVVWRSPSSPDFTIRSTSCNDRFETMFMPDASTTPLALQASTSVSASRRVKRQRLLAKHVLLRGGGGDHLRVCMCVRRTQDHASDVRVGQNGGVIGRKLEALRPRPFPGGGNRIHGLYHADFRAVLQHADDGFSPPAQAGDCDIELSVPNQRSSSRVFLLTIVSVGMTSQR